MVKFPEAEARKFRNIFVCKKCKTKMRTTNLKVIQKKVKCRNCNSHQFRAVKKK